MRALSLRPFRGLLGLSVGLSCATGQDIKRDTSAGGNDGATIGGADGASLGGTGLGGTGSGGGTGGAPSGTGWGLADGPARGATESGRGGVRTHATRSGGASSAGKNLTS